MPIIRKTQTIAAGENAFPLVGSQYEYLPFNALVEFAIIEGSATPEGVQATVYSGSDLLQEQSEVDFKANNTQAIYPDDYNLQDVAAAGERIGVQLNNPGAGTATVLTVVRITPL